MFYLKLTLDPLFSAALSFLEAKEEYIMNRSPLDVDLMSTTINSH